MTIPSSVLIQEIRLYEGFCAVPRQNRLGMPCIGYGFPLWEEALAILHGNSKLAKCVKNALPNDTENISTGMKRLEQIAYRVSEETAQKLLEQSLLYYAEELGRTQAGFRHLVNLCGNAHILPQSSMARYEAHLRLQQGITAVSVKNGNKKPSARNLSVRSTGRAEQNRDNARNGAGFEGSHAAFSDTPSACGSSLHPAFLASAPDASSAYFSPAENTALRTKSKKKGCKSYFLELTEEEQALLRADAVLFLTHVLGLELVGNMHEFFRALKEDNYALAASELLAHSASSYLGGLMPVLARRIREASLDFRDISVKELQTVQFLLHRRKAKNYTVRRLQQRRKPLSEKYLPAEISVQNSGSRDLAAGDFCLSAEQGACHA